MNSVCDHVTCSDAPDVVARLGPGDTIRRYCSDCFEGLYDDLPRDVVVVRRL